MTSFGSPCATIFPFVEHNHFLPERKHFLRAVGDDQNRHAVMLVPLAQIVKNPGFCRAVEGDQGSSSNNARGSVTSARASATRCRSPPRFAPVVGRANDRCEMR